MTFIQRKSIAKDLILIGNIDYEVGDLICYRGKCYNNNNFYAVINRLTQRK